ncbi:hypothetical protein MASR1M66_12960 [Aminivibrio sp.]
MIHRFIMGALATVEAVTMRAICMLKVSSSEAFVPVEHGHGAALRKENTQKESDKCEYGEDARIGIYE